MAADKELSFSPREMEVLAIAWQCMETQPKIDIQKLARLTGYTPGSASVTMGNIKRKLKLLGESLSQNGPATPKKTGGPGRSKTTTPKRGGKRAAAESDAPSKRQKQGSRKAREQSVEDEDEVLSPTIKEEERDLGFHDQLTHAADIGNGHAYEYSEENE
ncbi:Nn.00g033410.m01.CDS01 [Neocucurbitaria sp. VM-36]